MTGNLALVTGRRRYCEVGTEHCTNFVHTIFMLTVLHKHWVLVSSRNVLLIVVTQVHH